MRRFTVLLADAMSTQQIDDVTSFRGEDESGSFAILGGHARFMTILSLGLAQLRVGEHDERYLATSGGVLYFHDGALNLYARRIFLSDDLDEIRSLLEHQLREEEAQLASLKDAMRRVEEQIFYRLRNMLKEHG
jgi:F-type H+-transporting ATPase subunit epsilon